MEDVSKFKNLTYNFLNAVTLNRSNVNSVKYETETIISLDAKILPNDYKWLTSLLTFKSKIKNWETNECPCRLRKTYIKLDGFIVLGIVKSDQCLLNILVFILFLFFCFFCCCCCFF